MCEENVCFIATTLAIFATVSAGCEASERQGDSSKSGAVETKGSEGEAQGASAESAGEEGAQMKSKIEPPEDVEVVAHRGARALRPENTLPSVEVALDARPDIIEIDLHLSQDGKLVVWHDPFVRKSKCRRPPALADRNAEGVEGGPSLSDSEMLPEPAGAEESPEGAKVRNLSASNLRSFVCAENPDPGSFPDQNSDRTELAGHDYGIVTLSEFFEFVERYASSDEKTDAQRRDARRVEFFLETKRHPDNPSYIDDGFDGEGPARMEKELVSVVREFDVVDRTIVQGFTIPSLWAAKELEPDLRLSVAESERDAPLAEYAERGASYWSPNGDLVDEESLEEAHEAGLRVVPWTVNESSEIERLIELGVDGLITDDPTLFAPSSEE